MFRLVGSTWSTHGLSYRKWGEERANNHFPSCTSLFFSPRFEHYSHHWEKLGVFQTSAYLAFKIKYPVLNSVRYETGSTKHGFGQDDWFSMPPVAVHRSMKTPDFWSLYASSTSKCVRDFMPSYTAILIAFVNYKFAKAFSGIMEMEYLQF
jgi:hypothetical protein